MDKPQGQIITFYSYKGGTGRSMALANVAWILASNGKKVLAIDWDLEAPGLHRYFAPFLVDKELSSSEGLMNLIDEFRLATITPEEKPQDDWYESYADVKSYAVSLDWDFNGGRLDLLPAGRQNAAYSGLVNSFNWDDFYLRHSGGAFFEAMKRKLRETYDYVLIDSRTGVSDTSGICTVQMPDALVVCFTLNNQSIEGAASVAASADEQRREPRLKIYPVQMRVELFEKQKLIKRKERAKEKFGRFLWHLPSGMDATQFLEKTQALYMPFYAYEEILAAFGDRPDEEPSLLMSAERLTDCLTDGAVSKLAPPPEERRKAVMALFEGQTPVADAAAFHIAAANAAFGRLGVDEQIVARRVYGRLVRLTRPEEGDTVIAVKCKLNDFAPDEQRVVRTLADAQALIIESDSGNNQMVRLAHESLVKGWPALRAWLLNDREFLLWRQQLNDHLVLWLERQDEGALLSGAALEVGQKWRDERKADLNETELNYIRRSEELLEAQRFHEHQRRAELEKQKSELLERQLQSAALLEANKELEAGQKRRRRLIAVAALLVAVLVPAIVLFQSYYQAQTQTAIDQAASLTLEGIDQAGKGDIDQAIEKYNQALESRPEYPEALYNRGLAFLDKKDDERAMSDFNRAISAKSDFAEARVGLGNAYLNRDEDDKALEQYQLALRINDKLPEAYINLGHVYADRGDQQRALENYGKAIELNPKAHLAYVGRGVVYLERKDFDQALKDFNSALELKSDLFEALFNRGNTYLQRGGPGDYARAVADFNKATGLNRDAGAFLNLAIAYQNLDERDNAIANYDKALSLSREQKKPEITDSAQRGLTQLRAIVQSTLPAPDQTQIYLHYQDANDLATINAIGRALSARPYYKVQGKPQLVTQPTSGDVRYFYEEDAGKARDLKKLVEEALRRRGVQLSLELRFPKTLASRVPKGWFEVWLPPLTPVRAPVKRPPYSLARPDQSPVQAPSRSGRELKPTPRPNYQKQ
jgi:tetratricopeptide (TPR) repeat protein/cellulose biosynthesis protein BcsQ